MAVYTQKHRRLNLTTPLGADALVLTSFSGREEMSRPFSFRLNMLSDKESIAAKDIVGKTVTFSVDMGGDDPRYFNGVVSRFVAGRQDEGGMRTYFADVVPWIWFLGRTTDCRMFQNKDVKDIVKKIFDDLGFSDYSLKLNGSYAKREYCVQYRETDLNFVARLLEEEGIFYFFTHEDGKHTLNLADAKSAYKSCKEAKVEYREGSFVANHIARWEHHYEYRSGKWAQTDYNFETPKTSLMTNTNSVVSLPDNSKFELYDYPGRYAKKGDGTSLTKVRMEEEEAAYDVVRGESTCVTFTPGGKFTLSKHYCASEQGKGYAITAIEHEAKEVSMGDGAGGDYYTNSFTCIPDAVVYRPVRQTPRPIVGGPQTAVVVGPKGEEIYTDKYGRIKVQFFWDREGKNDENSSCWIRVAENWAGKNWGIVFNPRIGQEVIVDFLEGDPDRPIITGRVYNAEQMPPYDLPANQTQSVIKTRSSKGGSTDNFNELRFEDKKGSEDIFFHAELDFHREVERDDDLKVGRHQTVLIQNNRTETIKEGKEKLTIEKGDREETLKDGNETITYEKGNRTHTLKNGDEAVTLETGSRTHKIKKDEAVTIEGKQTLDLTGNRTVTIKQGNDSLTLSAGNRTVELKAGNDSTKLTAGKSSTEAMQGIELKVGSNSIVINPAGITIKGMMIKLEGQVQVQVKAPITQVNGDGMLQLKGGVTMIG